MLMRLRQNPNWGDAPRHLFTYARSFSWVADKIIGGAVDCAHSAPLGGRGIVPGDGVARRSASKDTPSPVCRISNESAGIDQHLFLH
jgi:hypothetical protein